MAGKIESVVLSWFQGEGGWSVLLDTLGNVRSKIRSRRSGKVRLAPGHIILGGAGSHL